MHAFINLSSPQKSPGFETAMHYISFLRIYHNLAVAISFRLQDIQNHIDIIVGPRFALSLPYKIILLQYRPMTITSKENDFCRHRYTWDRSMEIEQDRKENPTRC